MIKMTITNAGRQALINSGATGTNAVTIAQIGVGTGKYTPTANQTALNAEIKRVPITEGGSAGDNAFHVLYQDASEDAYQVHEIGLFLDTGVLFAVYSSTAQLIQKTSAAIAMIAIDVALTDIDVSQIEFGAVTYSNPAATTTNAGVLALATDAEVVAGEATQKALTPANIKALTATTERVGLVEIATEAEAKAGATGNRVVTTATLKAVLTATYATSAETISGTVTDKAVTPAGLKTLTATTGRAGLIEMATDAEATAGTDTTRAVNPKQLKQAITDNVKDATTAQKGIVQLATTAEATAGTNATKAVTPAGVKGAIKGYADTLNGAKVVATGSTAARTLADRFADGLTPKDFGATGNGTTNDSAAFTALEAQVSGRMVDLEGLTYVVSALPKGNSYYNGFFKVGSATYLPASPTVDGERLVNAQGANSPSLYPSGRSSYYQARNSTNQLALARFTDDASGNSIVLLKSRSGTVNTSKSAVAGDTIGWISFLADNGNVDYVDGATQGARAALIEGGVFESSKLTAAGTTNVGVRGYIRLRACSDGNDRTGTGVEVIDNAFRPLSDDTISLGTVGKRWKAVYAVSDVVSTSDENLKQDIDGIPDAALEAWRSVRLHTFRFKHEVAQEGDAAKTYFGVIAQEVIEAFEAQGLDPFAYGIVTAEKDDDGVTVYGIRYREAMVLEAALQRQDTAYAKHSHDIADVTGLQVALDDLRDDIDRVQSAYRYKGSVATVDDLPSEGQEQGDVWNVEADGQNYGWTGEAWDALGPTIDLEPYATKEQVQTETERATAQEQVILTAVGNCVTKSAMKSGVDTQTVFGYNPIAEARTNNNIYLGEETMTLMSGGQSIDVPAKAGTIALTSDVATKADASALTTHEAKEATSTALGHVKLGTDTAVSGNYAQVGKNANGQLSVPMATATTMGCVKKSSSSGNSLSVIGVNASGQMVLNVRTNHSGFDFEGGGLYVQTSTTDHPTAGEAAPVATDTAGKLVVTDATTARKGAVKLSATGPVIGNFGVVALNEAGQIVVPMANSNDAGCVFLSSSLDDTFTYAVPTTAQVKAALDGKQDTLTFDTTPTADSTNPVTSGGVNTALAGKQDTLKAGLNIKIINGTISTLDSIVRMDPSYGATSHLLGMSLSTAGNEQASMLSVVPEYSTKYTDVKNLSFVMETISSSGAYSLSKLKVATVEYVSAAIAEKQDALTFDTTPTSDSTNPVTSGGVKAYVDGLIGDIQAALAAL